MRRRSIGFGMVLAAGLAATLAAGCGGGGGTPDAGVGDVSISQIPDQTIDEDGTTGSVAFTVSANATLTGASSDQDLVPNAGVVFGGSGTSRTVTVTPAANKAGMATITVTARLGSATRSVMFRVTVRPINDAPTISNITDKATEEGMALPAIPFTVGDPETAAGSLQVTAMSNNTALVPASGLVVGGSGASRTLTVTPASTGTGTATITVRVSDGSAEAMDTFVVTVNPSNAVNDPPANTVPGAQSSPENTPLVFSAANGNAVSIFDVDAGNASVRVTLEVAGGIGTLSLAGTTGLSFQAGDGTGDTRMTFTGTIAAINAALNGLTLTPPADENGMGSLTVTTDDLGNTGTGGAQQDVDVVQITITRVDAPPVIREIADISIQEDGTTGPLAFTITDSDTPLAELEVSVETSNLLVVPQAGVVLSGTGGNRMVTVTPAADRFGSSVITVIVSDGDSESTMSFTVTVTPVEDDPTITEIADQSINAGEMRVIEFNIGDAFGETNSDDLIVTVSQSGSPTLTLTPGGLDDDRTLTVAAPTGANGVVTVTVTVRDEAGRTASTTFQMTVNNINDPPVIEVPAGPLVLHTDGPPSGTGTLTFTSQRPIVVRDDDIGDGDLRLRLQATNGTTSVGDLPTGVSRVLGADESDDQTLEGPIDLINEVLDGMHFTSEPGSADDGTLVITANDQGNSGTGGAQTATEELDIKVNVKPTISEITNRLIDEDGTTGEIEFTVHDFEQNDSNLTVTVTSSNDALVPEDAAHLALGGSLGIRLLTVTPVADAWGQTTITVKVVDSDGGERRDLFVLIVDPVNDAPELEAPAEATTTEDVALAFDGTIEVTDIDDDDLESVSIEATDGTVTLASTVGLDFVVGDGEDDAALLFSGSVADVNAALDGATFVPDQDFNGEALLSIEVDDGEATAEEIIAIEVEASNDAPVIDSDDGIDTLNRNETRTIHLAVSDVDVTASQEVEVTFVVTAGATIDIPDRTGLQFLDDEADMVRFRGTLAEVNASLDGDGIEVIPADNFNGDVTLTGTVSDLGNSGGDGVRTTTRSWVTTFDNPNTNPTITGLPDSRTIDEDDDGDTVTFTVGDGQTQPGNLEVTASATGTVVVKLTVGGSGANRTVTAVPAPDDHGTATITVRVTDGDRSTTDTYQLVVTPVNDRPVIEPTSIATVTIDEDGFADVTFSATDADGTTPTMQISSDTTALLPNSSFTMLSTSGVRIRPVAERSGSATVMLTASDGTLTATRTFTVVVRAVNDAPVLSGSYPDLSVDDEEVGEGTYQVTIDANGGTVTLATVADLTFVDGDDDDDAPDGDGSKDSHMIFRGDQDAVNDALDGLVDTVENGEIVIVVSDLGVSPPTSADPELTDSLCVEVGTGSCD